MPPLVENNVSIVDLLCVFALCQFMPLQLHKLWVMPATTVLAIFGMGPAWKFVEDSYTHAILTSAMVVTFLLSGSQRETNRRGTCRRIQGLQSQE